MAVNLSIAQRALAQLDARRRLLQHLARCGLTVRLQFPSSVYWRGYNEDRRPMERRCLARTTHPLPPVSAGGAARVAVSASCRRPRFMEVADLTPSYLSSFCSSCVIKLLANSQSSSFTISSICQSFDVSEQPNLSELPRDWSVRSDLGTSSVGFFSTFKSTESLPPFSMISYPTCCPSARIVKPARSTAAMCTKTSGVATLSACCGRMKPNPFLTSNHFTVPVGIAMPSPVGDVADPKAQVTS